MAKAPTEAETEKLLEKSRKADEKKSASQEKQGKKFDNLGQGVIPEIVWKKLLGKTEAK